MKAAFMVIGLVLTIPHVIVLRIVPRERVSTKRAGVTFSVMAIGVGLFFAGLAIR